MPGHNARSLIAGLALVALVAGCNGGSGNRPAPRGTAAPATSPPVADGSDTPAAPSPAPHKPNRKIAKAEEPHPSLDPNVNPLDVFISVPEESRWQIVQAEGKRASADAFTAILPPKGVDSTRFEPLNPPELPAAPAASARRVPPVTVSPVREPEPPSSSRKSSDRKTRRPPVGGPPGRGRSQRGRTQRGRTQIRAETGRPQGRGKSAGRPVRSGGEQNVAGGIHPSHRGQGCVIGVAFAHPLGPRRCGDGLGERGRGHRRAQRRTPRVESAALCRGRLLLHGRDRGDGRAIRAIPHFAQGGTGPLERR